MTLWVDASLNIKSSLSSLNCFSLIGTKCPYGGDLLIVCTALAVPKTALTKRKTSKIRHIFHVVDLTTFYLVIRKF